MECHKLDNDKQVFFYEQDFYVLSNFSAFAVEFAGVLYPTSEHAYHAQKFVGGGRDLEVHRNLIQGMRSAHDAFKYAEAHKAYRRPDWDHVKTWIMKQILMAKAQQHEYVLRKLLATGDRELIEDSWRDDVWGWGPNKDGQNLLGKLWMEVRANLQQSQAIAPTGLALPELKMKLASHEATIKVLREALELLLTAVQDKYMQRTLGFFVLGGSAINQAQAALAHPVSNEHLRAFGMEVANRMLQEGWDGKAVETERIVNEIIGGGE